MKTTEEKDLEVQIVNIIDPLCIKRYKFGECLPRGQETSTINKVNEIQGFRERSARAKARRIIALISPKVDRLEAGLRDIHTFAHCIAKAGPANVPTLEEAWPKFMEIGVKATNALQNP